MTAIIIFWFSVAAVFHSYVLFPVLLRIIHRWHRDPQYPPLHSPPKKISILIAAYNEEEIIITKLQSILDSDYPSASYEILIGSDASTDQTNLLVTQFDSQHPGVIRFYPFKTRRGKPNIMNHLATEATGEILVLTDANVLFDPYTLTELIRPFSNSKIGLVDTQMNNLGMKKEGISYQEKAYISREVRIKFLEGSLWGTMMGPFGGCYAIRRQLFEPIPPTYLVDDFFLNMCVLDKGFFA
ncbi:MAG: glycosyltransferase, partial [Bacteroidales bacterium]|nr:glycosyltransferase [Bacteroidales bacterium]